MVMAKDGEVAHSFQPLMGVSRSFFWGLMEAKWPIRRSEARDRTHYRQFRRGGYPLGSGGIESSNKFICHVRLKRSGAWWYEGNSNQMLALRCAKYNGTFKQVFKRH